MRKDTEKELEEEGLSKEMISLLFKHDKLNEFRELLHVLKNPNLVAKILLVYPIEIASKENISIEKIEKVLSKDALSHVLETLKKGKISEGDLKYILTKIIKTGDVQEAVKVKKEENVDIEEEIMNIIKEKPGLSFNAYMGLVMKELKGRVNGKEAAEIIKKYVN